MVAFADDDDDSEGSWLLPRAETSECKMASVGVGIERSKPTSSCKLGRTSNAIRWSSA